MINSRFSIKQQRGSSLAQIKIEKVVKSAYFLFVAAAECCAEFLRRRRRVE